MFHPADVFEQFAVRRRVHLFRAVAAHLVTTGCGHYTTIVQHPADLGDWWFCGDARVAVASGLQRHTASQYQRWGTMQSYVAVCELASSPGVAKCGCGPGLRQRRRKPTAAAVAAKALGVDSRAVDAIANQCSNARGVGREAVRRWQPMP